MSDPQRIKELLLERVAGVAQHLFPNGRRVGKHWRTGSINGEAGNSFDICIDGAKAGFWGDFADSKKHSRDLLNLWMEARRVDFKTALSEAANWLGVPLEWKSKQGATKANATKGVHDHVPFDWTACVTAFSENDVAKIAKWRGYSIEFVRELREKGWIGIHN